MKIYQIQCYPSYCSNQMIIADICHDWRRCTLFELLYFFANRSQTFGLLWPIWVILLQIYALVGVLLQAEIMRWCTKNGQITGMQMMFLTKNVSICSLDHMSLLPRGCPAVLNYSLGEGRAGRLSLYPLAAAYCFKIPNVCQSLK